MQKGRSGACYEPAKTRRTVGRWTVATEYELYQLKRRIDEAKAAIEDLVKYAQHIERIAESPEGAQVYLRSMADAHRKSANKYAETLKQLEQELIEATGAAK